MITEQLDSLFNLWEKEYKTVDPHSQFYRDGIINESLYIQQAKKILFVTKEPNGANHDSHHNYDFRIEWTDNQKPEYEFARRIAEWSYGIINNFPVFDEAFRRIEYLERIAFMNIKKTAGKGIADMRQLKQDINEHYQFIQTEIDLISPNIIILCIGKEHDIRNKIFENAVWSESGYKVQYANVNGRLIIDFYHPTARNVAAAAYSLLQNVLLNAKSN